MPSDFPEDRGEYKLEAAGEVENGAQARLGAYFLTQTYDDDSGRWTMKVEHEPTAVSAEFECLQLRPVQTKMAASIIKERGSMTCEGTDNAGGSWKLEIQVWEGQRCEGKIEGPKALEIDYLKAFGKAPGYQLTNDDGIQFAVRPPNISGGAEVWIAHEKDQPIGAVGAAISLLLFVPEPS